MAFETVTCVRVLRTELTGVDNEVLVAACVENRHKKVDDNPNATGYEDSSLPHHPEVGNLRQHVNELIHTRIDSRYYLGEIWAHILQPMQSTMIHSHRNVLDHRNLNLSWVYYPHQHPPESGGRLRFQMVSHMMMNNHEVIPTEGHIVIFPSWLNHYTTPNTGTEDRISISGNMRLQEDDYDKVYRDSASGIHEFYK